MKLHLPKQLFTALLAVITLAVPVSGLEITGSGDKTTITLNAGQSYYGAAIEYIVDENGIGTTTSLTTKGIAEANDDVVLTFELNHAAFDNVSVDSGQDSAKIIWVTNSAATKTTWGMAAYNANTSDTRFEMCGLWENVEWSSADYIDIAGDGKNTYTIKVGENGTYLYEGTGTSGTRVYNKDTLKASGAQTNLKSVSLNSAFIETFNVQEYGTLKFTAGEWSKAYNVNEVKNAAATVLTVDSSNAESISASKHDIIAGGNGQLKIIAKDAEHIELGNVVYLAATKTAEKASINIDNTGNVSLSGPIYLLENSSMSASGTGSITISGTVTDKNIPSDDSSVSTNSTLSLSGTGYNFTGAVDVTGLNLTTGTGVTFGSGTHAIGTLTAGSATVTLEANSSLTLGAATHTIGTLTGSGALNMSSSASNASATISKLGGYTGSITVDKAGTGTAELTAVVEAGSLNMAGISVKNGATATIKTRTDNNTTLGSDISLGNVAVGGNSTLTVHFSGNEMRTATLTTLDVNGTAAVVAKNYHGQISINSLTSSGDTNALTLTGNTPSDAGRTVFNLKDGAFDGSINFIADASGTRKFALNIENSSVVQDAVINTSKTSNGGDHHIAIGIGADSVTVKGLTGGAVNSGIYSGSQQFGNPNVFTADSSKFRTLIIDTDGSKGLAADATAPSYSTSSSLSSNLNLQKDGAGSQTFTGNLSAFNGTVTVNQGTLALQSTAAMNNIQSITVNSGELAFTTLGDVSGGITMTGGRLEIGTWNITTTQEFTTSGDIAVKIGTVNIAPANTLKSSGGDDYFTHIYGETEKADDGNGYRVQSGDFILFEGLEWDENWGTLNVGGYGTVKSGNGNILVTVSNAGTGLFYINNDAMYTAASILGSHGVHLTQGKTLDLAIGDEQTLSTELTGEGSLKKSGTGTLALSGTNTYSGGTTIAAGTLSITDAQSLGTGGVTVEGSAELEYAGSTGSTVTALTLKDGATVNTSSTGTLTATTAAAKGAFTKNGTGTLVLSDVTQLSGTVTVNAGILQISSGEQKLNSAQVNGGTLRLTGTDIIDWGDSVNIQVSGGTLDLDARQSVDSTTAITLNNGTIEGDGGANRGYTVGLELHNTSTLTITSTGASSISTNIGMRKENGDNGGTVKFNVTDGALTVSGKIEKNQPTGATISGKVTKSGAGELILSGNNTYANGTTIEAGTVTTQHTNALGSGGVTMTGGELKVTDVADTDSDLSLKGMLEMNATASAKLATAGTTLNLGTTGSVKKTNAGGAYVTISSDGTNAASMAAKSANAQLVQLKEDASFTIADMTLTNTKVTATDTKVNLNNITASGVMLNEGSFTMQGQLPVALVSAGGMDFCSSALSGLTLNTADSAASLTVDLGDLSCLTPMGPGRYDLTITLSGFSMDNYSGLATEAGLVFAADSWLGQLLGQANNANVQMKIAQAEAEAGAAAVAEGGSAGGVSYSSGNVGTIITITGLNVPEPTTSTLSLLALAALAARRRRKA